MAARILLILGLLVSFVVEAATTSWIAYDLKNCKHWSLRDDFSGDGPRFDKAKQLEETRNAENTDEGNGRWLVIEGGILWESGEPWYGVCRFESSFTVLSCLPGVDFPLAGAAYKLVSGEAGDNTYVCIRGCEQTEIKMIIEEAYEEKTVISNQASRLIRQFSDLCHDEAKRREFFQKRDNLKINPRAK